MYLEPQPPTQLHLSISLSLFLSLSKIYNTLSLSLDIISANKMWQAHAE